MTVRQVFSNVLTEINKVEAPSLLLEDFVYFLNKSIAMYVNKRYGMYEENQQLTDDLRVLTGNTTLSNLSLKPNSIFKATYAGILPQDYLHILNCSAEFELNPNYDSCCGIKQKDIFKGVTKMTSKMYSGIIDNYYLQPSHKNPYFYLRNVVEPVLDPSGTQRTKGDRDGNSSPINIEIIYGKDDDKFKLKSVRIDYLKVPQYVTLTQGEIDNATDTTQTLEFPDYVCLEIIKELVALIMENASDQRLQTNLPINQSIAPPMQTASGSK